MSPSPGVALAVALPVALLVLQALLNVPQLIQLWRRRHGGVPLVGEALSVAGGIGWLVWAALEADAAIAVSALLALAGFGPTTWLLVRAGHPWRLAAALATSVLAAAAAALLVGGLSVLGTLLTGAAALQYGAILVAAARCRDWSGYSTTSGGLRIVYGLGWALHGDWQGNDLIVVWGLMTAVTFAINLVVATRWRWLAARRATQEHGGPAAPRPDDVTVDHAVQPSGLRQSLDVVA